MMAARLFLPIKVSAFHLLTKTRETLGWWFSLPAHSVTPQQGCQTRWITAEAATLIGCDTSCNSCALGSQELIWQTFMSLPSFCPAFTVGAVHLA